MDATCTLAKHNCRANIAVNYIATNKHYLCRPHVVNSENITEFLRSILVAKCDLVKTTPFTTHPMHVLVQPSL